MKYNEYVDAMLGLAATTATDTKFAEMLPRVIEYAEQRCYRELHLISQVTRDGSVTCAVGTRLINLPTSPYFNELTEVNIITPAGVAPDIGVRNPLTPASKSFLDATFNSAAASGVPAYFSMLTDTTILVGPWPSAVYTVEFVGMARPLPLSPSVTSTFLTLHLPDLFVAASMIFVTGYQRDFGAQSEDPRASQSWEDQYGKLLASANAEEMRRRFSAVPSAAAPA